MSVYDHRCGDCQICPACGKSAWCEGDRILVVPCEDHGYCGDCNIENCRECQAEAEREMFETGVYNPRADPLADHTRNTDDYYARLQEWREQSGYDATTNTYRRTR